MMTIPARLIVLVAALLAPPARAAQPVMALVGATVIDVSNRGVSRRDIPDAVILVHGDKILAVGSRKEIAIPTAAVITDFTGKFVIPGLVDGFCGMRSQEEANAELYEGVTTIVASGDDRRGTLFLAADPSPHVYPLDSVGSTDDWSLLRIDPAWRDRLADGNQAHELISTETKEQVAEVARRGSRAIWIGHNITRANSEAIIAQAHHLHLATYGEFVATPYQAGIEDGVASLLHMSRFELGLAPTPLIAAAASDPEGTGAKNAYAAVDKLAAANPAILRYGDMIEKHHVALMPTFSLYYLLLPNHRNLWREKSASILDPKSMGFTSDPDSGELAFKSPEQRERLMKTAAHLWEIDKVLIARHPTVLAASGSTWQGTLPGISLHTELELLVRAGLTPRQALASATNNYSDQFDWTELGAVVAGRRADLVVLDQDPTLDITNADRIDAVFLSGTQVDRTALLKKASVH